MRALALVSCVSFSVACGAPIDSKGRNGGSGNGGSNSTLSGGSGGSTGVGGSSGPASGGSSVGGSSAGGSTNGGSVNGGSSNAGSANGGTDGGSGGSGAEGGTPQGPACENGVPVLTAGTWVDISPPWIPKGDAEDMIGQGLTMHPNDPKILFWGNTPFDSGNHGGLYKTTDAGCTWVKTGDKEADEDAWDAESTYVDEPLRIRIDPDDPNHMYVGDGVRGSTLGFWVSTDGGENWSKSQAWQDLEDDIGFHDDIYDVAVDPTDFEHVLVSSHGGFAGVLESTDGGDTWIVHEPESSWGSGMSIDFLYEPDQAIGNADTWLLGTQGDGYWRTTNSGDSWTKVSSSTIFHGGGETYYSKTGVLYATSWDGVLRSTNNGASFVDANSGQGNTGVWGDGDLLYTGPAYGFGAQPFATSPEDDGLTWTPGTQTIDGSGPYEMVWDEANGIMYASMWFQGVWALKVE
jgi:hypothetical protein